jgi:hypothetical protein
MLSFQICAFSRGSERDATLTAVSKEQMWQLSLEIEGRGYSAEGWDCLDAFNKIRSNLEGRYAFLCNGARPNFILSPMTSQAGGFEGYVVPNGRKARLSDLVPIFDPAPADAIGSVEEQSEFRKNYMDQVQRGELSD